jgi:hypothetical protein
MVADHRAQRAHAAIAVPSPAAARLQERSRVTELGMVVGFAALAVALRIGADTAAHGYQPCFERLMQLFG